MRVLVNLDVSSCFASGGSTFLDAIHGINLIRFGTDLAGLSSSSGLGGLAGDSRGRRRSLGASIHGHGDDEKGGLVGILGVLMVVWKANDACRKVTKWIIVRWREKRLQ